MSKVMLMFCWMIIFLIAQIFATEFEIDIDISIPRDLDIDDHDMEVEIEEALINCSILVRYDLRSDDDIELLDLSIDDSEEFYDSEDPPNSMNITFYGALVFDNYDIGYRWFVDKDYITFEMIKLLAHKWDMDSQDLTLKMFLSDEEFDDDTEDEKQEEYLNEIFVAFVILCASLCLITLIISSIDKFCNRNELFEFGSLVLFVTYTLDFFSGMQSINHNYVTFFINSIDISIFFAVFLMLFIVFYCFATLFALAKKRQVLIFECREARCKLTVACVVFLYCTITDIFFLGQLQDDLEYLGDEGDYEGDIQYLGSGLLVACVTFIVLPMILNIRQLIIQMRSWRKNPHIKNIIEPWAQAYMRLLIFLSVLSGSAFTAVELCNSGILSINAFQMGLPRRERAIFKNKKFFSVVLFENIPQFIIQIVYVMTFGSFTGITGFAMVFSLLSMIVTVVEYCTKKSWLASENLVVIQFTIGSRALTKMNHRQYRERFESHRKGIELEISKLLKIDRLCVETLKPLRTSKGVLLNFNIRSDKIKGSEAMKILSKCNETNVLSHAVKKGFNLKIIPQVSDIETVNINAQKMKKSSSQASIAAVISITSPSHQNQTVSQDHRFSNVSNIDHDRVDSWHSPSISHGQQPSRGTYGQGGSTCTSIFSVGDNTGQTPGNISTNFNNEEMIRTASHSSHGGNGDQMVAYDYNTNMKSNNYHYQINTRERVATNTYTAGTQDGRGLVASRSFTQDGVPIGLDNNTMQGTAPGTVAIGTRGDMTFGHSFEYNIAPPPGIPSVTGSVIEPVVLGHENEFDMKDDEDDLEGKGQTTATSKYNGEEGYDHGNDLENVNNNGIENVMDNENENESENKPEAKRAVSLAM